MLPAALRAPMRYFINHFRLFALARYSHCARCSCHGRLAGFDSLKNIPIIGAVHASRRAAAA
jgi:hypothetical protein